MKRTLACAALCLTVACGDATSERKMTPLEAPSAASTTTETATKKTELEKPPEIAARPAAQPAVNPSAQPAIGAVDVEAALREIGPINMISNDDAKKQADNQINAQNAEAELQRLKDELGGGG